MFVCVFDSKTFSFSFFISSAFVSLHRTKEAIHQRNEKKKKEEKTKIDKFRD